MFDLTGKKALITGASGGIGEAIARTFHARGATVMLSGTRQEALKNLASSLGERSFVCASNLAEEGAAEHLISETESALGGLDLLVNNAGLTRDNLSFRMKDEEWEQVLRVNLTAVFKLTRAALKNMMRQRYGRIINIASVVGHTGNPGQANYVASKAGLVGLVKTLALEVASRSITVNCIAPGFIQTAMTEKLSEEQTQKIVQRIPMGQLGTPQDIANGALFLASEEARYMTGQVLHINGGMAMI